MLQHVMVNDVDLGFPEESRQLRAVGFVLCSFSTQYLAKEPREGVLGLTLGTNVFL